MGSKSIKEQVAEVMKSSLKSGDKATLGFARNLHSAIRKVEIDTRTDLQDSDVIKIVFNSVKQRQDSVDQFRKGGRDDLVAQEEAELRFLQQFLPAQLGEAEVRKLVQEVIAEVQATSAKDLGKVMKVLLPKTQGKADGKLVNQVVREFLK